jgi:hypothetical protein
MEPSPKMQRATKKILKQSSNIVDPTRRKYVIQMNPQTPRIKTKIKIHQS